MFKNINLLIGLLIIFSLSQCVNNKISLPNTKITIKVVDDLTNKPIYINGTVELKQMKRTLLGFIKVYHVDKKKLDSIGMTSLEINSKSKYLILLTRQGKTFSSDFIELDAKKINLNDIFIIKCEPRNSKMFKTSEQ